MRDHPVHLRAWGLRARVVLTTLVLAAAAWIVFGPPRAASAAKPSSPIHHLHSATTVIEHAVTDTVVHSGGPGDVTGNLLTFHNKVYDFPGDSRQVGTDQGTCIRIAPSEGSWECSWTTFLSKGQITVEGPYYDTKNSELAITGGTGAYATARGQMDLISKKGGTEYDFVFHVR